ncbi:MAG TPA: sortase [Patescibacteria group bacterium]|nr:sortase [Patescibacteria group bacterium]
MVPYRYVKRQTPSKAAGKASRLNARFMAVLLVVVGLFFFINAAYPIISYQLLISPRFSTAFISPNSDAAIAQTFGPPNGETEVLGTEIDLVDYTKASNWFPEENTAFAEEAVNTYQFSIPKLGIDKAVVVVGMEDLKKSLVQYPGTASPGRFGNTVIFGHSVLPQFFNPKNYLTIFSTLPTLKIGDEIFVDYGQVRYKFVIEQMIEVAPNDISILAQRYDDAYLTLITCVPPGTYLRRLIIRARLTKI